MAIHFHLIWQDQCDAARGIKDQCGTEQALGYLIGEKLVNFVRASADRPLFAAELPNFIAEVKDIFDVVDLRVYLSSVERVGALAHVCSEEDHEFLRRHDAIAESPVQGAENVLIMERIRELLLA